MTSLKLVARLTDSGGAPLQGKPIYFYYSTDGSTWINFVAVATDSSGYASTTYDASGKTWFRAEFKGDDLYEPVSATAVWEPSVVAPGYSVAVASVQQQLPSVVAPGYSVAVASVQQQLPSVVAPSYSVAVASVSSSLTPTPTPSPGPACSPVFRMGIDVLDKVLFCVGGYGVSVTVLLVAVILLIFLIGR